MATVEWVGWNPIPAPEKLKKILDDPDNADCLIFFDIDGNVNVCPVVDVKSASTETL